jgi:hypothetical protein
MTDIKMLFSILEEKYKSNVRHAHVFDLDIRVKRVIVRARACGRNLRGTGHTRARPND